MALTLEKFYARFDASPAARRYRAARRRNYREAIHYCERRGTFLFNEGCPVAGRARAVYRRNSDAIEAQFARLNRGYLDVRDRLTGRVVLPPRVSMPADAYWENLRREARERALYHPVTVWEHRYRRGELLPRLRRAYHAVEARRGVEAALAMYGRGLEVIWRKWPGE